MEPITREEKLMSGQNLVPITRKELFLAKAAGMDVQTPEPITREEMFLSQISGGSEMEEQFIAAIERDASKPVPKLPDGLTKIGDFAFFRCPSGGKLTIPKNVLSVGTSAFMYSKFAEITFLAKPSSIDRNAFESCSSLLTINVPWEKGGVAGAPWGATNATINYNYTGG